VWATTINATATAAAAAAVAVVRLFICVYVCVGVLNLFTAWEPTKIEIRLLHENPKRRKVNGNSTIGVMSI